LGRPVPVDSNQYKPNKLGLCHMHGNVWQWCADLYQEGGSGRVIRSGSWHDNGSNCRAAYRFGIAPAYRNYDLGFRLVRVPAGPLGMKFVRVPKATFYMGWDGTKKGVKTEIKE